MHSNPAPVRSLPCRVCQHLAGSCGNALLDLSMNAGKTTVMAFTESAGSLRIHRVVDRDETPELRRGRKLLPVFKQRHFNAGKAVLAMRGVHGPKTVELPAISWTFEASVSPWAFVRQGAVDVEPLFTSPSVRT